MMTLRLHGIDHIYLSVTDLNRSEEFYDRVMAALGLHKGDTPIGGARHAHYVTPSFQLTIRQAGSIQKHDPESPGLHHLCFQALSKVDVDGCYQILSELGLNPTEPKLYPEYNPEYYATYFEDPDGIRLEIVSRTSYRRQLSEKWSEFHTFLNPLQTLRQKSEDAD